MTQPAAKRPATKVFKVIGLLVLSLFVLQILLDCIALVTHTLAQHRAQKDLENAKILWENRDIQNYSLHVRGMVPLGCIYDAILTIRQGELVEVLSRSDSSENSPYEVRDKREWDSCQYARFTVPQVFQDTEDGLKSLDLFNQQPQIVFDPTYGYVRQYGFPYVQGYGLLSNGQVWDCCARFEFSEFQPLP